VFKSLQVCDLLHHAKALAAQEVPDDQVNQDSDREQPLQKMRSVDCGQKDLILPADRGSDDGDVSVEH